MMSVDIYIQSRPNLGLIRLRQLKGLRNFARKILIAIADYIAYFT